MNDAAGKSFIDLTANIVSAYLSNNPTPASEIPALISQIHAALQRVSTGRVETPMEPAKPAVSVKKSMTPDYLVCLEDGKRFKSLKRHLRTQLQHDAGAIPGQMESAGRLSDGRAELRGGAFATGEENGIGPAAPAAEVTRSSLGQGRLRRDAPQEALASASRASERMRSTMARRPLERCGVRCSRNPNSSNTAIASVARICCGVWPE